MISEDDSSKLATNANNGIKKVKGVAARTHREKEQRDRQKELVAQRAEAANKRNARSERRRGDGMLAVKSNSHQEINLLFEIAV